MVRGRKVLTAVYPLSQSSSFNLSTQARDRALTLHMDRSRKVDGTSDAKELASGEGAAALLKAVVVRSFFVHSFVRVRPIKVSLRRRLCQLTTHSLPHPRLSSRFSPPPLINRMPQEHEITQVRKAVSSGPRKQEMEPLLSLMETVGESAAAAAAEALTEARAARLEETIGTREAALMAKLEELRAEEKVGKHAMSYHQRET